MNGIFDFQRLLQRTYAKLGRASQGKYAQNSEGMIFEIPPGMIDDVVVKATELDSLVAEFSNQALRVDLVGRTEFDELMLMGEDEDGDDSALVLVPSGMYVVCANDPRQSYFQISEVGNSNHVKFYPEQSAVAYSERHQSGFFGTNEREWRKAIEDRIETVVLPALDDHYQAGLIGKTEFSNTDIVEWTFGEEIDLSNQLTVNFEVFRSSGMRPNKLAKTIAEFFWNKLAMPGQVYTSPSKNKEVRVSVLVEVPQ